MANESRIAQEMTEIPEEPLLPVEIKLIAASLTVGLGLLVLLVWVSYSFFKI